MKTNKHQEDKKTQADDRLHLQVALPAALGPLIRHRMQATGCKTRAEYVRLCVERDTME